MSSNCLKVRLFEASAPEQGSADKHKLLPFANSEIFYSKIESAEQLTEGEDVKTVYRIALNLKGIKHEFLPGDTIGICAPNNKGLVVQILDRLNLKNEADQLCEISISGDVTNTKKKATVPKHLPPKSTLREIFLKHVDIQTPPKKLFLKSLAKHTENPTERQLLEACASPKTSPEYTQLLATNKGLLDLLNTFPSCQPPIEAILEHLPPLLPRPYSISSSPLSATLEITFFVLERDDGTRGLCTGWLQDLIRDPNPCLVPFYFRQPTAFRLPNPSVPTILVATGTGIAPFRAFLQHRHLQGVTASQVWLFYGCRYRERDYCYRNELDEYLEGGVLSKLDVSFSRDGLDKNYVQHNILKHKQEVREWIATKDAKIFMCGDLKTVVKDVKAAFVDVLRGEDFVQNLQEQGRFVIDNWL